jgi:hypothetical protein
MRKFLSLTAIFAAMAGPALPQSGQKIQIATCTNSGCTCRVSNLTLDEIAATVPITIPPGAEDQILVRTPEGRLGWSDMAPADLDLLYGGPGNCPLQLFDEIAPQDGNWQIIAGATNAADCPILGGSVGAPPMSSAVRQIYWQGSFHPDKLMTESAGMVRWSSTGPRSWRGVLADEALTGNDGATAASVIWTMTLVSPTEVQGNSVFDYSITSFAGDAVVDSIMAGLSCKTQTPFVARRVD